MKKLALVHAVVALIIHGNGVRPVWLPLYLGQVQPWMDNNKLNILLYLFIDSCWLTEDPAVKIRSIRRIDSSRVLLNFSDGFSALYLARRICPSRICPLSHSCTLTLSFLSWKKKKTDNISLKLYNIILCCINSSDPGPVQKWAGSLLSVCLKCSPKLKFLHIPQYIYIEFTNQKNTHAMHSYNSVVFIYNIFLGGLCVTNRPIRLICPISVCPSICPSIFPAQPAFWGISDPLVSVLCHLGSFSISIYLWH